MTQNEIIGSNIKQLREKLRITQSTLGEYLRISREEMNYYENGKRTIPTKHLSELARLFGVDEYDFYEKDCEKQIVKLSFAFRADDIPAEHLPYIADFKKIVMNYITMKKAFPDESLSN
ncbi:MAG: hypothetical protein QG594_2433 [Bacteroidota bacterium]|nr:hypothetical protein [Bacteroidota bacterium]